MTRIHTAPRRRNIRLCVRASEEHPCVIQTRETHMYLLLSGLNHGTFLHIAHEEVCYVYPPSSPRPLPPSTPTEATKLFFSHPVPPQGLIRNTSIHAGIRGPLLRPRGDIRNDERCGFARLTARDLDRLGTAGLVSRIRDRVSAGPVYVSVDIDVLDPAFAPGKQASKLPFPPFPVLSLLKFLPPFYLQRKKTKTYISPIQVKTPN